MSSRKKLLVPSERTKILEKQLMLSRAADEIRSDWFDKLRDLIQEERAVIHELLEDEFGFAALRDAD
jgi:hypothetical protein